MDQICEVAHGVHLLQLQLRQKLVTIVSMKKNFTDDEVVSVSQELDYYLVEFQRKMLHEQTDR
ncbi:aspartyl-phosphate phosphatase Spo0E family protein [Paenibacillus thiaminolyticus]|uniref:aspartyl-phosphate phosphatase Spo0E family protein n=1 Tax=Paenibacillus thiaminolyticus TaxID=49283 RepID=UPI0011629D22|nr:aspartyl-phosphate phosphatase Spo0E family protein [Paenibacillus thiaminolyticus]NGP62176.1 aspartyl-phosphate phosphatase Spo0E family protein [Paenibacillus thiaminolyticus]